MNTLFRIGSIALAATLLCPRPAFAAFGFTYGNGDQPTNTTVAVTGEWSGADVVVLIDESGSLDAGEFTAQSNAIVSSAVRPFMQAGGGNVRVGVVKFSSIASVAESLTSDIVEVTDTITTRTYPGGATSMHTGLATARQELTTNGRAGVPKWILLVTDGACTCTAQDILTQAITNQSAGITTWAVGYDTADVNQLDTIASNVTGMTTHYFGLAAGLTAVGNKWESMATFPVTMPDGQQLVVFPNNRTVTLPLWTIVEGPNTFTVHERTFAATPTNRVLTIGGIQTAPMILPPASATIAEDTAFEFTGSNTMQIVDPNGTDHFVELAVQPDTAGLLLVGTGGPTTVTGNGTPNLRIAGTIDDVNLKVAGLSFQPSPDFHGEVILNIIAGEAMFTTSADYGITVTEVNDSPYAEPVSVAGFAASAIVVDASVLLANSRPALNVTSELEQTMTITAVPSMSTQGATLGLSGNELIYAPPSGFAGEDTFNITLSDNGTTNGVLTPLNVVVTVTMNVLATPSITGPTNVEGPLFVNIPFGVSVMASPGAVTTVRVSNVPASGSVIGGVESTPGTWIVALNEVPNIGLIAAERGVFTLDLLAVSEIEGTSESATSGTHQIVVSSINDTPVFTLPAISVVGNVATFTGGYEDRGGTSPYRLEVLWGDLRYDDLAVSGGTFSAEHSYEMSGTYEVTARVRDSENAESAPFIANAVVGVSPPTDAGAEDASVEEDAGHADASVSEDAGHADASMAADSGAASGDGGAQGTDGSTANPAPGGGGGDDEESGCGCHASNSDGSVVLFAVGMLVLLRVGRRNRRR